MPEAFLVRRVGPASLCAFNYNPSVERLRARTSISLGQLQCRVTDSFGDIFTALLCAPGHGVQLLSQVDTFSAEPEGKWVRPDSMNRPETHKLKKWQIALAGAGQMAEGNLFGRSMLVDDRFAGLFTASDSVVLEFEDPGSDLNCFTYAYLNTPTGLEAVRSCAYGTSIPRIRLDLLREIPIPIIETELVKRIATLVRRCVEQREIYLRELRSARRVIETLSEVQEAYEMCADRSARTAMWSERMPTLCAWNYVSPGDALAHLLKRWTGRLADVVPEDGIFRGGRYQRIPCAPPFGTEFLSQRDVFSIRPTSRRIIQPRVPRDWVYAPEFSILAGGQGTLGEGELFGRVAIVSADLANAGITEHLLRIQPSTRSAAATLFAFLSTLVGRRLLRSTGVGTKLLSLRPDLVLALPYPEITKEMERQIVGHLEAACAARVMSSAAESEATRIIEQGVSPAWLA